MSAPRKLTEADPRPADPQAAAAAVVLAQVLLPALVSVSHFSFSSSPVWRYGSFSEDEIVDGT